MLDAESQSRHFIVTSPACGRGRGLSRGRGHHGAILRVCRDAREPSPGPDSPTSPEGRGAPLETEPDRKRETFSSAPGWGGLTKRAENRRIMVDAESQRCHAIVTSPACGRGRGLSRGRGPAGAIFRVCPDAREPSPGPDSPQGEVPPRNSLSDRSADAGSRPPACRRSSRS